MDDIIKSLEDLPLVLKVILTILYGIYGNIIRICKSVKSNNAVNIILAILLLIFGGWIMIIVDLIFLLQDKEIWWIC